MKISNEEVSRLFSVSARERSAANLAASTGSGRDIQGRQAAQVNVSATAQEIVKVKKLISELPDVRESRVQALKAQVESGTYNVSGEDIADLIIRRTLADNTAL